jgi:Tfp pilus assembly protein PilV
MRLNRPTPATTPAALARRRRARGFGLLDGVIGLVIFSFGLLAMTRFQARMVASTTEVQGRLTALQFSDELISSALVDPNNRTCYTKPQAGACGSARAIAQTTDWATRTAAALPGTVTTSSTLAANGQLTVAITWTGKESGDQRRLEATTDVRP